LQGEIPSQKSLLIQTCNEKKAKKAKKARV